MQFRRKKNIKKYFVNPYSRRIKDIFMDFTCVVRLPWLVPFPVPYFFPFLVLAVLGLFRPTFFRWDGFLVLVSDRSLLRLRESDRRLVDRSSFTGVADFARFDFVFFRFSLVPLFSGSMAITSESFEILRSSESMTITSSTISPSSVSS